MFSGVVSIRDQTRHEAAVRKPNIVVRKQHQGIQLAIGAATLSVAALVLFWCEPGAYTFYPVCAFHKITGLLCPGCGSLRALHQLLHGHFLTALRFNPLLVTGLPFMTCYIVLYGYRMRQDETPPVIRTKWWWVLLVIAVAFTVWRNIPGTAFSSLPDSAEVAHKTWKHLAS